MNFEVGTKMSNSPRTFLCPRNEARWDWKWAVVRDLVRWSQKPRFVRALSEILASKIFFKQNESCSLWTKFWFKKELESFHQVSMKVQKFEVWWRSAKIRRAGLVKRVLVASRPAPLSSASRRLWGWDWARLVSFYLDLFFVIPSLPPFLESLTSIFFTPRADFSWRDIPIF